MLVKCYEENWFRDALIKYCTKVVSKDLKYSDDKMVVQELIKYFDGLNEDKRGIEIENLDNVLSTS